MAHCKRIQYSGEMDMLSADLLEALDTDRAIVRRGGTRYNPHTLWLSDVMERFLAAKRKQRTCVRRDLAEYDIQVRASLAKAGHRALQPKGLVKCIVRHGDQIVYTRATNRKEAAVIVEQTLFLMCLFSE
ncbi:unnamed protein product [Heligmosomoides polygyrus]|uniref:DUF2794 domain-containing protein n=1 Tax=Heligmosomoides polygyrus TaxID=6339 RepID=A0A183GU40_HELPZ|nr:unnamed protein product [Heligmosomoides polygyrus]